MSLSDIEGNISLLYIHVAKRVSNYEVLCESTVPNSETQKSWTMGHISIHLLVQLSFSFGMESCLFQKSAGC